MTSTGDHFATVRTRAVWPAIAAGLMLWYANRGWIIPTETSARIGGLIFVYTLWGGGVAMAIVAVWLFIGQRIALAVDGIAGMLIGLLLCGTGVLFLIGGYTNNAINILFGVMFFVSGRNSFADYMALGQHGLGQHGVMPERSDGARTAPIPPEPINPPSRLVLEPIQRNDPQPIAPPPNPPAQSPVDKPSQPAPVRAPMPANEPPPEGFLAQFADDKDETGST